MKTEQFLKAFHNEAPGETPEFMNPGRDDRGRTSYQIVIESLPKTCPPPILDLACGDGFLLSEITKTGFPAENLIGIDMSEGELNRAKSRSELSYARLELGNARKLLLGSGSVSAVTCHMALMLMPQVDEVLTEVARVLEPQGKFLAFINRRGSQKSATLGIYFDLISEFVSQEQIEFCQSMTDSRLNSESTIEKLYKDCGFEKIEIIDGSLTFKGSPAELVAYYGSLYYRQFLTPEKDAQMRSKLALRFNEIKDADGLVSHEMLYRMIRATK